MKGKIRCYVAVMTNGSEFDFLSAHRANSRANIADAREKMNTKYDRYVRKTQDIENTYLRYGI